MASWKSTITRKLCEIFPTLNCVNADLLRDYFRKNFPYYRDLDESYPHPKTTALNKIIEPLRKDILLLLIQEGVPIILNHSWLYPEVRKEVLDLVPDEIYTKILIQSQVPDEDLEQRIKKRDREDMVSKNWLKFHLEMRKHLYQEVSESEAEIVKVYNQNNFDEIEELIHTYI